MSSTRRIVAALGWIVVAFWPAAGAAQNVPLMELGSDVFKQILVARTPGGTGIIAHTPVFLGDPTVTNVTDLIDGIHEQVGTQISLFPIGSSSGGFTYQYDPSLGTFSRSTTTFGPAFAERASTIGRGKMTFGVNYLYGSYNSLDGKNLQNGDVKLYLLHQPLSPPSFVQGDVIQAAMDMRMTTNTAVLYGSFGVTDWLDVGVQVPFLQMKMDITYHATILDFATHNVSPTTHVFANGGKTADFSGSGSAAGVGDMLLHGKFSIPTHGALGVAAAVDVRLPTGDTENMLGTGATLTQVSLITSGALAPHVVPHLNVGYTFARGSATVSDQVNYVGGIEVPASPKLTILGDIVGRTLRNSMQLTDASIVHQYQQGNTAPFETVTLQTVQLVDANLNSIWGAAGVKFTPWRTMLIGANVLFALNNAGLRSRITPNVGIEFTF